MLLTRYRRRLRFLMLVIFLSIRSFSPLTAQTYPTENDPFLSGSPLAQKMDFLRSWSATLEARWNRLTSLQKSAAYIKRITPFYSWINLCTAVDVDVYEKSFLIGDCLQDESDAIFRLPIEQFRREHTATIERLWATSELDAMTYASVAQGESTTDRQLKDIFSVAQLVAGAILAFVFLKRFNASLSGWMSAIGWTNMKRAFYFSVAAWLLGGAALQIIGKISGLSVALMNLQTLVLVVFGGISIILGIILFGRWVWNRNPQY